MDFPDNIGLNSNIVLPKCVRKLVPLQIMLLIEREAGDVIRVGFDFFIQPLARKNISNQFMTEKKPNSTLQVLSWIDFPEFCCLCVSSGVCYLQVCPSLVKQLLYMVH